MSPALDRANYQAFLEAHLEHVNRRHHMPQDWPVMTQTPLEADIETCLGLRVSDASCSLAQAPSDFYRLRACSDPDAARISADRLAFSEDRSALATATTSASPLATELQTLLRDLLVMARSASS